MRKHSSLFAIKFHDNDTLCPPRYKKYLIETSFKAFMCLCFQKQFRKRCSRRRCCSKIKYILRLVSECSSSRSVKQYPDCFIKLFSLSSRGSSSSITHFTFLSCPTCPSSTLLSKPASSVLK